jgi:hypothetical protein
MFFLDIYTYIFYSRVVNGTEPAYKYRPPQAQPNREKNIKRWAQGKVQAAVESGRLKKEPCEICGNPKTHAHHENYERALEVRWLCSSCHLFHHSIMKKEYTGPRCTKCKSAGVNFRIKTKDMICRRCGNVWKAESKK